MKRKQTKSDTQETPNPIQIQKYLKGADYPVDKNELLKLADENGADENVRQALAALRDGEYDSPTSVSHELNSNRG